ncbi:MAG: phenylalanine--tRNA ligase subunit beta [Campylobacterota bacterium]|nr:phenylalanine--tRNA ligase subunit beta [Campylobacterota bacterium]
MIVTRSWLSEFVDLDGVSNEKLYETFNAIGLEVDSIKTYEMPEKVVVGKILSCEKHPDADKLNVCQIDVGTGMRQIVCGAANVVDAEYVAVAMIGAVLPGDFKIKHAKLRGVESEGMVCASSELGLPDMGKGIMILDESIGELEVGRELGSYANVADTVIELELTANRGDCLSIHGVARDLSVALERELKTFEYKNSSKEKLGIARVADVQSKGDVEADLSFALAAVESMYAPFLIHLRLAMVGIEPVETLSDLLHYAIHASGVILRAYDGDRLMDEDEKILLHVESEERGIVTISSNEKVVSVVGVNQSEEKQANNESQLILFEASYIHPDLLVEAVANSSISKDELYYKTSRGSESRLRLGIEYLASLLEKHSPCKCYDGYLNILTNWEPLNISVDSDEICSIIGQEIEKSTIVTILKNLGFEIHSSHSGNFGVVVPRFRHDIRNIQDLTEEIVRIVGINNIKSQPLAFIESSRITNTTTRYQFKKELRHCASATGLYENISYVFSDRSKLEAYGFACVEEALDLTNPIAEDLNTLRSTILINLLEAVKRNVNYTEKSIGLFEIGAVFNAEREQSEVFSMIFSGQDEGESVVSSGKPNMIDFASFVERLGAIIGAFELVQCTEKNSLIHPYQSADILCRGQKCGYVSKLHPIVQEAYGIYETFIAELDFDMLLPVHINVKAISKFQGVYKDLSVVVDQALPYSEISNNIAALNLETLKKWYPVDVYEDESLGEKKSLTVRFFIQSMDKTLEEGDIDTVMSQIMEKLEQTCQAALR